MQDDNYINLDYINKKLNNNSELIEKIKKLKIPPNWKNVYISKNYNSKIQAYGHDNKNRKQYIYHPCWKILSNEIKFSNCENFNFKKLHNILSKYKNINIESKLYVISNMIQLIIDLNIRVGNELYLKENDTVGLCTMQKSNFIKNFLCFKGKRGILHNKILNSEHIKFINNIIKLPGNYLFKYMENKKIYLITPNDINDFLKKYVDKNLSTKDIRTYQANKIFSNYIKKNLNSDTSQNLKKLQINALKFTANELGNTTKVCKDSYINPNNLLINL